MVKAFIPFELFRADYPTQNHSTRVYEFVAEDVIVDPEPPAVDWDHVAGIDGMLDRLYAFIVRSVAPPASSDGPGVSFNDTLLQFTDTVSGIGSSILTVTLTNTGNAPLQITGVTTTGDFVFLEAIS